MSWKKMIMGEKMPDKNDPKYRDQYEQDVAAGRKFAQMTRIDKAAAKVQDFANCHQKLFLILVFGFILLSFGLNIYRMGKVYMTQKEQGTVIEQQQEIIKDRMKHNRHTISAAHTMFPNANKEYQATKNNNDNGYTDTEED